MKPIDFEAIFVRIGPLRDLSPAAFTITPLPGLTNANFRLRNETQDWVLRVPREATGQYVDRDAEQANQALAADLGLAPRTAWRDADGLSLTPTIAGSRALTAAELVGKEGRERVIAALRLLHRSGGRFAGRVDLEALLERYFALLEPAQQRRLQTRLDAARLLLPAVADRDADYVPSHNDLVLENLMSTRQRLWLIDWEFSAMASPYWDLATICNAAALDYDQSLQLLRAYCADSRPMEESLLFDYRNLLQLLSDCWMAAFVDA